MIKLNNHHSSSVFTARKNRAAAIFVLIVAGAAVVNARADGRLPMSIPECREASKMAETDWSSRVLPLPQEMRVESSVRVLAGKIRVLTHDYDAPTRVETLRHLATFAKWQEGESLVDIRLAALDDSSCPDAARARLATLPNSDQAYIIDTVMSDSRTILTIAATTPLGWYYGAQTLAQLVRVPVNVAVTGEVELPIVSITDWPDIAERGVWSGQRFTAEGLRWLARWKINMVEPKDVNAYFRMNPETGQPMLRMHNTNLVAEAAQYGIKILLSISHLDSLAINSGLNAALTNERLKYWIPALKTMPAGVSTPPYGICPSSPVFKEFLEKCLRLAVEKTYPYHHDCCIWLSENIKPCGCADCKGRDIYALEVATISEVFSRVREDYPELRLRILCSQGVYPASELDLALLPEDCGLVYYSGSKTYVLDRNPMIPPLFAEFAQEGRRLGVMPLFAPLGTIIPFTCPQLVKYRMQEFAGKHLTYTHIFDTPTYQFHKINLAAAGEWGWNAQGRDERAFARAYATINNYAEPEAFADWAVAVGDVNYDLAESRLPRRLGEMPLMGFDKIHSWEFFFRHASMVNQPGRLGFTLQAARDALALAVSTRDPEVIESSRFSLAAVESFAALWQISKFTKQPNSDGLDKYRMGMALDQLHAAAATVCANVYAWQERIVADAPETDLPRAPSFGGRTRQAVIGFLKLADYLQAFAAPDGAVDRWPLLRPAEIGEWQTSDFIKGRAVLKFDVSRTAPESGGRYFLWTETFDGAAVRVEDAALAIAGTGGTTHVIAPFLPPFERRAHDRNCFDIPARAADEHTYLTLTLTRSSGASDPSSGMINWRRLPRVDEVPAAAKDFVAAVAVPVGRQAPTAPPPMGRRTGKIMTGVISGGGASDMIATLNLNDDVFAFPLTVLAPEHLAACDVIIVTLQRAGRHVNSARLNRAVPALRHWVQAGGGLLCHHSALGFGSQQAVFGEVASINGSHFGCTVRAADPAHPVTAGLMPDTVISIGNALRTFKLEAAPDAASVLADSDASPVFAVADRGQGRVALSGMFLAFDPAFDANETEDANGQEFRAQMRSILLNTVRWLAE